MVCMAGLQVFIVRFFFQGARKGECRDVKVCDSNGLLKGCRLRMRQYGVGALGKIAAIANIQSGSREHSIRLAKWLRTETYGIVFCQVCLCYPASYEPWFR